MLSTIATTELPPAKTLVNTSSIAFQVYVDCISCFLSTSSTSQIASGHAGVTVAPFTHSWTQFSIIAKIPGSKAQSPVTIIGAHMDSINLQNPTNGRAPGTCTSSSDLT